MKLSFRYVLILLIIFSSFLTGCVSGSDSLPTVTIVSFSDVHFDPFYDTTLFDQLVAASADEWETIFQSSAETDPATWGENANYPLFAAAVSKVCEEAGGTPFIIYTGDFLTHNFSTQFYELYGSEDETAMKEFTYKTIDFFVTKVRNECGTIPVAFTLGNNDSYDGDYQIEPAGEFLSDTSGLFYTKLLMEEVDLAPYISSYGAGGYYYTNLLDSYIRLISLNTIFFSPRAASSGASAAEAQLTWFYNALSEAWLLGQSVWIIMHIPPGADIFGSVSTYMDDAGQLSDAAMMWEEDYQERMTEILTEFAGTIDVIYAGHTHMDEYRLSVEGSASSNGQVIITPGISPLFGNNPALKKMTVDYDTWQPADYESFYDSLEGTSHAFSEYYTFSTAYSLSGILDDSLATLVGELDTDEAKKTSYTTYYYSGHDASNPITDTNWPAYKCGIEKMDKDEYIDCVNNF